jgi:hypothetical protein
LRDWREYKVLGGVEKSDNPTLQGAQNLGILPRILLLKVFI